MKLPKMLFVAMLTFVISCGPSKQDEVAAKSGCRVAEQYEKGYVLTDVSEADKTRAQKQLEARVVGYKSHLEKANPEAVNKLIESNCPGKTEYIDKALSMYP